MGQELANHLSELHQNLKVTGDGVDGATEEDRLIHIATGASAWIPRRAIINNDGDDDGFELDGKRYKFWLILEQEDEDGKYRDFGLNQAEELGILQGFDYAEQTLEEVDLTQV